MEKLDLFESRKQIMRLIYLYRLDEGQPRHPAGQGYLVEATDNPKIIAALAAHGHPVAGGST
jgi:hypothetical protein